MFLRNSTGWMLVVAVLLIVGICVQPVFHSTYAFQTPANSCPVNQFVNSQLANTGQSCAAVVAVGGVVISGTPASGNAIIATSATTASWQTPAAGTVTSFTAGSFPSFLTPTVTNSTTTPSLSIAASAIPNGSLANSSTTVNGQSCVLGGACTIAIGTGTVTSFAALTANWPTWLVPSVATSTSTPSLSVAAGAIPNTALANSSTTVNGQTCTLGSSCASGGGVSGLDFTLISGLFSTVTAVGPVYYVPDAAKIISIITRIQGSPICTAAPTVVILDLGTSASTVYASATVLTSQATGTSNGVFSNIALSGVNVAAGHFIGYGLSAGACVTPPTITTTIGLQ